MKDAPDGYFLLDLSWKFNVDDFSFSFMIKNLLNKKYRNYLNHMRYFADELGRNFIFNLLFIQKEIDYNYLLYLSKNYEFRN